MFKLAVAAPRLAPAIDVEIDDRQSRRGEMPPHPRQFRLVAASGEDERQFRQPGIMTHEKQKFRIRRRLGDDVLQRAQIGAVEVRQIIDRESIAGAALEVPRKSPSYAWQARPVRDRA